MAFEEVTCLIPLCDGCGPDWMNNNDTGYTPHFVNADSARRALADEYDWLIESGTAGEQRMLCPACATQDACDRLGHDWHSVDFYDPEYDAAPRPPAVMCDRCSRVRRDAPAADHPDSMTAELPAEHEEWLAAVDAQLWPKEAV